MVAVHLGSAAVCFQAFGANGLCDQTNIKFRTVQFINGQGLHTVGAALVGVIASPHLHCKHPWHHVGRVLPSCCIVYTGGQSITSLLWALPALQAVLHCAALPCPLERELGEPGDPSCSTV